MRSQIRKRVSNFYKYLYTLFLISCVIVTIEASITGITTFNGYFCGVVLSDSMEPTYDIGTVVIAKKEDIQNINIGDIVVYRSIYNHKNIIHRVVSVYSYNPIMLSVKGDNNKDCDVEKVCELNLIGKAVGSTDRFKRNILNVRE